ncbi:MAG: 50S ribosomal protein L17 [Clostridia bacterium]|nr:50S ribosomal protein L17 [Oscillospiraceae bacterium]MBQ8323663.1 50S ribosomal protein L17 [Clostridia bacterium]MBR4054241.1 50S ribosomal protein L17 [Clostridia bacterium]
MPGNRKLGRSTSQRMAMLKGMVTFLLEKGRIETTVTRAKEVSALTDKMITLGKANTLASKRQALSFLKKEAVVYKLFTLIAPNYEERNGGYTRVLKIGPRRGDGAEMAIIELVDAEAIYAPKTETKKEKKSKKEEAAE